MHSTSIWLQTSCIFLSGLTAALLSSSAQAACEKPWIFFDVGNTLVLAQPDPHKEGHLLDERYVQGVVPYLKKLRSKGYPLGLISNIPPEWGEEDEFSQIANKLTRQLLRTQKAFSEDWKKGERPFDWSYFGTLKGSGDQLTFEGRVYFPTRVEERKPRTCPDCTFNRALEAAKAEGCQALYIGESREEMAAAERAGFIPFWYQAESKHPRFIPENKIRDYMRNYRPGDWKHVSPQLN
jgi:hypothetical protein